MCNSFSFTHFAIGQKWFAARQQITAHILVNYCESFSSFRLNFITNTEYNLMSITEFWQYK